MIDRTHERPLNTCRQCSQPVATSCRFWDDKTPRGSWNPDACQSLRNFDARERPKDQAA